MDVDVLLSQLETWARQESRPGWMPDVEDGDVDTVSSKFGGAPALLSNEQVPTCGSCAKPLSLLVQLNLDDLPEEAQALPGQHTLQLFYCTNRDCEGGEGYLPFNDVDSRCRVLPTHDLVAQSPGPDDLPAKQIVSWSPMSDIPHPNEHDALGLHMTYDFANDQSRIVCESIGIDATVPLDDFEIEEIGVAAEGDKLRGWPAWIQGREMPHCPTCGVEMEHLFQVDSEVNVDFMFGDAGIGHITQCPTHRDIVGFGWACS